MVVKFLVSQEPDDIINVAESNKIYQYSSGENDL